MEFSGQGGGPNRGIFGIPISGGDEERIIDLKEFRIMGCGRDGNDGSVRTA